LFLEIIMKSFVSAFVIVATLAVPALSMAQESSPAVQSQQRNASTSDEGGVVSGKEQTGSLQKRFGGASSDSCVGPVSYCSVFFGS
jgi:hypothetical protein